MLALRMMIYKLIIVYLKKKVPFFCNLTTFLPQPPLHWAFSKSMTPIFKIISILTKKRQSRLMQWKTTFALDWNQNPPAPSCPALWLAGIQTTFEADLHNQKDKQHHHTLKKMHSYKNEWGADELTPCPAHRYKSKQNSSRDKQWIPFHSVM